MKYTFRIATKNDRGSIENLFVEMLQSVYHTQKVQGYKEGDLDAFLDSPDNLIFVAENEGAVVAYLSIEHHHEPPEFLYLDDLCVTKQHRNLGIGTRLIGLAEELAAKRKVPNMVLHVEKSNLAAFRLYERLGYHVHADEGSRYRMIKRIE